MTWRTGPVDSDVFAEIEADPLQANPPQEADQDAVEAVHPEPEGPAAQTETADDDSFAEAVARNAEADALDADLAAAQGAEAVTTGDDDQDKLRLEFDRAQDIESLAHARMRRPRIVIRKPKSAQLPSRSAFAVGVLAAVTVFGFLYRDVVVAAVPETAVLFETVGLPVNLRGVDFIDVTKEIRWENGAEVLHVYGQIVNVTNEPVGVPAVQLTLKDSGGVPIYAWIDEPLDTFLGVGESLTFQTRLAAPPADATALEMRFTDRSTIEDTRLGLRQ